MSGGTRLVTTAEARRVRRAFASHLPADRRIEPHLRGVVRDTLAHPGSLARAQLAFGLATRRGVAADRALRLAIAVEYFHAASLILDDMPAMDDARERRGRPCPHLVYGEAAATLGALAFITRAYALLWDVLAPLPRQRREQAAALVADCLGLTGILDGQARDVHFGAHARRREILAVAAAKTVPLVRLALVLPALVAGERPTTLDRLSRLAEQWGLAYQILDDFKDDLLSPDEAGKTTHRDRSLGRPNLPARTSHAAALGRLAELLSAARSSLAPLVRRDPEPWSPLLRLQTMLDAAAVRVAKRLGEKAAA